VFILSTTFAGLSPETTVPQVVPPCFYRQEKLVLAGEWESGNA
jgi:hypothetical protein